MPEIIALFASAVALVAGGVLAWQSNPTWLNRAGSIIVIIGILLAASRFHEWMAHKVSKSIEKNPDLFFHKVLELYEKRKGAPLTDEERVSMSEIIKEEHADKEGIMAFLSSLLEPDKKRLKLWEINIVVVGTFLSGFGDYMISILKFQGA